MEPSSFIIVSQDEPKHNSNEKCHNSLLPVNTNTMEEELNEGEKRDNNILQSNNNDLIPSQQQKIMREISTQNDAIEQQDSITQTENVENSERILPEMLDMQVNTDLTLNQIEETKPKADLCDQEIQVNNTVLEEENRNLSIQLGICREQLESQSKQILELQGLLQMKEDELSQVRGQIKALKLSFLGQLANLRDQLALVKNEQSNTKQNIDWSLKKTIEFLISFVSSSLSSYINER